MTCRPLIFVLFCLLFTLPVSAQAPEPLDLQTISKIREEGLQRSQVMEHLIWLADIHGARLTGSPALKQAGAWAQGKLREWGLANVHAEEWPFGRGWRLIRFDAHLIEPQIAPLLGAPKAWTSGTNGRITAEAVLVPIKAEADFDKYRGKLKGKIVLTQLARTVRLLDGRVVLRYNENDLQEALTTPVPASAEAREQAARASRAAREFQTKLQAFLQDEGALAVFERGSDSDLSAGGSDLSWQTQRTDGGTIFVQAGGNFSGDRVGKALPQIVLAVEHYNRLVRMLERNVPVKIELNLQVEWLDEASSKGFNVIAELPGSDLRDEIVLIGAHLDSWHTGTGATDNATGSAAMLEAMRILKTLSVQPRRTIRLALWGGEEEGLLGSRAYVREHFADPAKMELKPAHGKLAAYFNIDNGTGRIRGIWSQGNLAAQQIFAQWSEPLRDLGVNLISPRSVGSTDHVSFEQVGLPGFQFVQERLEYNSRTHHSNMDTVDHVQREDLIQMATVAAVFAYNAAMRTEKLPRKALPAARKSSAQEF